MVQAFRGVGKSWLTAAYVLWRLYRNFNERILVISASKDRADGFTVFVRQLIEDVPFLKILRPRAGRRDSVVSFDVGPSEPHQSPSVKSAGITGQITGSRATLIIADDIETPVNSATHLLRERLSEAVKEFDAILLPEGEVVYLGTPQTEMSLYKELPARGYDVRIWPARTPTAKKLPDYGDLMAPVIHDCITAKGEWAPTDPERFDEQDLSEREASYGRSGFALQFQLDQSLSDLERFPLKAGDLIVTDVPQDTGFSQLVWGRSTSGGGKTVINDLACAGLMADRFYGPQHMVVGAFDGKGPAPAFTGSVMFIDPSGGGRDETSYAVVKMCMGLLYCTASGGFLDGFATQNLQKCARIAKANKVNLVLVEPNYGGGMFTEMLKAAFLPIYAVTIEDAEWARGQKELRIIDTLEPLMNQHRLVIARDVIEADLRAAHDYDIGINEKPAYQLIHQMTRLTRERGSLRHDDRLESLAGACAYYVLQAGASQTQAAEVHEEALREAERQKFIDEWDAMHGDSEPSGQPNIDMRS
jgi:hypothetical protein